MLQGISVKNKTLLTISIDGNMRLSSQCQTRKVTCLLYPGNYRPILLYKDCSLMGTIKLHIVLFM